jgi:hypothetical protein
MMALGGAALRMAAPGVMQFGKDIVGGAVAGKVAENVGNHNEQQSFQDRLKARIMNEDPNAQGDRNSFSNEKAKDAAAGRSRTDLIFDNQLDASNKRADLQNTMAINDQMVAFKNGQQLADNYSRASSDQANASNNLASTILNRQATQYRASF